MTLKTETTISLEHRAKLVSRERYLTTGNDADRLYITVNKYGWGTLHVVEGGPKGEETDQAVIFIYDFEELRELVNQAADAAALLKDLFKTAGA